MNRFRFIIIILLFSSVVHSQVSVEYQEFYQRPQEDFYEHSHEMLFEHDELWLIENKSSFFRFLQTQSWSSQRIDFLRSKIQQKFNKEIQGQILSFYKTDKLSSYIVFDSQLASELQDYEVNDVYRYLISTSKLGFYKYYLSVKHFEQSMISYQMSPDEIEQVRKKIIDVDGVLYLIISKRTWAFLPNSMKSEYINLRTLDQDQRKGLNVQLLINDVTDIQNTLVRFVKYIDILSVEKKWLIDFRNGKMKFPLIDLMPPVVQNLLGKYSIFCGPNCLNAAISFQQGNDFKLAYVDAKEITEELKQYDVVDLNMQEIQTGDLLLIFDHAGNIAHAAVYILDQIVFTKNGASKFSPYIFQKMDTLLTVYPVKNRQQIQVYRFRQEMSEIEKSFYFDFNNPKRYCEKIFLNN